MGKMFDAMKASAEKHKFDCSFEGYSLRGEKLTKGIKSWPVSGAKADFQHGADVGARVTATRVMLTGVFALGLKKNRNKVYALVELADGEQLLIESKVKNEKDAREFVAKVNQASAHYAAA